MKLKSDINKVSSEIEEKINQKFIDLILEKYSREVKSKMESFTWLDDKGVSVYYDSKKKKIVAEVKHHDFPRNLERKSPEIKLAVYKVLRKKFLIKPPYGTKHSDFLIRKFNRELEMKEKILKNSISKVVNDLKRKNA